jgi:glycogen synthase
MKVLMFGWEFPPHISGGLGTACYGLTMGLKSLGNVEVIFVVPKAYGDEDQKAIKLLSAEDISYKHKVYSQKETSANLNISELTEHALWSESYGIPGNEILKDVKFIKVASLLRPYLSPVEFEKFIKDKKIDQTKIYFNKEGKLIYLEEGVEKEIILQTKESVETEENAKFHFTGKYGPDLWNEVYQYAEIAALIAQNNHFDVIHAHDWLTYLAGIAAKRVTGKPLVIHVHATEFDRSGEHINQMVYDIERLGMHFADKIITVSNLTRSIVIERYGVDPEKVITVYNAVEPQKAEKQHFEKNVSEKIVTFLGRVTFQKGPEYFVEAGYKVLQNMDNVRFVMAGSGDMLNRMIRRAAKLKVSDRFHFTDFLRGDDVTRMFAISDVYVMPSVSEPFGISPLEAMISGVPVIISKQSGVAEILVHAIKVDFWDIDSIADSIYGLLNYGAISKMFSRLGKQEVENLKWENAAKNVENIYESVLN